MTVVSIIIALVVSAVLGITISAAGLHVLLSFMPGKQQLKPEIQVAPNV